MRRIFFAIAYPCFLLLLFFLVPLREAGADSGGAKGGKLLTLEQAIALALQHNPALLARASGVRAADYGIKQARSNFLPRLDLVNSYSYSNDQVYVFGSKLKQEAFSLKDFQLDNLNDPDSLGSWRYALLLTQPLFAQGRNWSGLKLARLQLRLAELSARQVRQRIILETKKNFLHWLLAQERFKVLDQSVQTARANLQVIKARYRSGTALKSDLLQTEVHLARLQKESLAMKNQISLALSALNMVMGQSTAQEWQPVYPDFISPHAPEDLSAWLARAMQRRPEVQWYKTRQEMAEVVVQKCRLAFLPEVNLKGGYERTARTWSGPAGDNFLVQAELAFNLYAGQGEEMALKKARESAREISFLAKENKQRIIHEVRSAWLNLKTALLQLQVTAGSVAQSEEGLRIVQKRYATGLTIITELLAAQTALKQAKLDHLEARYAYQLGLAGLQWAAGVLQDREIGPAGND